MKSLDFHEIQRDLENHLSSHPEFSDYNYAASGVSALVGVLAYNAHYLGFYSKMMLDESFIDSAHTMEAILSHAKRMGYLARGTKASSAVVNMEVTVPNSWPLDSLVVVVPRGTTFKASNTNQDSRNFVTTQLHELMFNRVSGSNRIFAGDVQAYEGTAVTTHYTMHPAVLNEKFVIADPGCDISTLVVSIAASTNSVNDIPFRMAQGPEDVNSSQNIYFASMGPDGNYYIIFPKSPLSPTIASNSLVRISYLSTSGVGGNGAVTISHNPQTPAFPADVNNFDVLSTLVDMSSGGADPQTIEELKTAIPASFRRQNRAVTVDDIKAIITEEYRDVAFLNVWGGEDNIPRRYDKRFICVVPRTARTLSLAGRRDISSILGRYKIPGDNIEFVDAVPQDIDLDVAVRRNKTSPISEAEIVKRVQDVVDMYLANPVSSELDFSGYALSKAIREHVVDIEAVMPAVGFNNTISFGVGISEITIDYGNDVHQPVTITGEGITQSGSGRVVTFRRKNSEVVVSVDIVAYPLVNEIKAVRNGYFRLRTNRVRISK